MKRRKNIHENFKKITNLIDTNQKNLEQLKNLIEAIDNSRSNDQTNLKEQFNITWKVDEINHDKQKLIGILPYVLLEKNYFSDNATLVMFAKRYLKVNISNYSSKSRASIIGSIITEVAKKDPPEIKRFIDALYHIMNKQEKDTVQNFFWEWDKVIRG